MDFGFLVENIPKTKKAIGTDKGLAKIGDGIVNFTYSLAKSIYLSKKSSGNKLIRTGEKVSKNILAKALKDAEMKSFAKNRADSHDLANTVEAVIAYVWLKSYISIEEIVIILLNNLSGNIIHRIREVDNAAKAFTHLLLEIKKYLPEKEL